MNTQSVHGVAEPRFPHSMAVPSTTSSTEGSGGYQLFGRKSRGSGCKFRVVDVDHTEAEVRFALIGIEEKLGVHEIDHAQAL